MIGTVVAWGSITRRGQRQGQAIVLTGLGLIDALGLGRLTFQPERSYQFNQQQGGTLRKRHCLYAQWDASLDAQIAALGLNAVEPVQPGDMLTIPGVPPYQFALDDADAYPGHHLKLYTTTTPMGVAGL